MTSAERFKIQVTPEDVQLKYLWTTNVWLNNKCGNTAFKCSWC